MFNKLTTKTEENVKKDFKKLANYVIRAKGQERTVNGFAADMKTSGEYLALVVNAKITSYPTIPYLKLISDNSEGRVSLKDLTMACGYSNYSNNDMEQIKNLQVKRGEFCYVNLGEVLDSEQGGVRVCLVVQNNVGNHFSSTTLIIPLTSRSRKPQPTHVSVGSDCGLPQESIICCEQIRCVSKRRLSQNGVIQKIAECSPEILKKVNIAMLKSQGVIDIRMNEQDAIEYLDNMNTQKTYQYENNHNRSVSPQLVFA
ncbi:MAG TPA: type II toxin-antitoxin system PemK/MazF family toxin [Clostridium sp.]|uniref:type II toxin-antitoxin system PemK/MazF family toxin n=1 Tax=Clostridium sp. TaxID=1506 RepID=UPI002F9591DB